MKHLWIAIALVVACGKGGEEQAHEDMEKQVAEHPELAPQPPPPPATKPAPEAPKPAAAPPAPEPTTPAEIDKAFKQAMIDGRDKDVLKYCDMLKPDEKAPQSLMGCTLAACRAKDEATAKRYAAPMTKSKDGNALLVQAKKVCAQNQIAL